jgi:hypothetical protein
MVMELPAWEMMVCIPPGFTVQAGALPQLALKV